MRTGAGVARRRRDWPHGWLRWEVLTVFGVLIAAMLALDLLFVLVLPPHSHGVIAVGSNMRPAVKPGDHLLVVPDDRPSVGDIVLYHCPLPALPGQGPAECISRIAAVGGQSISCPAVADGTSCAHVLLDGRAVDESHRLFEDEGAFSPGSQQPFRAVQVPVGRVYLLGDHRDDSLDSRMLGTIALSDILGRVSLRYLPLRRFGGLG